MQYGDLSFTSEATGDFIGEGASRTTRRRRTQRRQKVTAAAAAIPAPPPAAAAAPAQRPLPPSHVSSRDIPMHLAYYRYLRAPLFSDDSSAALAALRAQLDSREASLARFTRLSKMLSTTLDPDAASLPQDLFRTPATPIISGLCVKSAVQALEDNKCSYDDFSVSQTRRDDTTDNASAALSLAIASLHPATHSLLLHVPVCLLLAAASIPWRHRQRVQSILDRGSRSSNHRQGNRASLQGRATRTARPSSALSLLSLALSLAALLAAPPPAFCCLLLLSISCASSTGCSQNKPPFFEFSVRGARRAVCDVQALVVHVRVHAHASIASLLLAHTAH